MLSDSILPIVEVGAFDDVDKRRTVQEFASKNCIVSIQRELPGQFLGKSLDQVIELRDAGDKAARKCMKLLGSGRFQK